MTPIRHQCTGVILAGGMNTRFNGKRKALAKIAGKPILARIAGVFRQLFDEILLITNDPIAYLDFDMKIASDIYPVRSSLTGIHAGLTLSSTPYIFVAACDTPFIKKEVVELVLGDIDTKADVVMPETTKGFEPLCAVYGKQCLKPMQECLEQEKLKIQLAIRSARIRTVGEDRLREQDPELVSFLNVNTPDDLAEAEEIAENEGL